MAVENAIRLDPTRYDVSLCITRWQPGLEDVEPAASMLTRLGDAGVRVIRLERGSKLAIWEWRPLLELLRRERVEILHGHLFGSNVWAALLGRRAGTPLVVAHEHMWAYSASRLRPFVDREVIARFAGAFVAVSQEGRRRMIEIERIDPAKIVVIPNGIAGFESGDGAGVRKELGIPAEAPVAVSIGHLRPEKAYQVLVDAASALAGRLPELHVLIAGEGPCRVALEAQIETLGLVGRVTLLGTRDDVPDLLAAADVAVCCSDFEGGPLSVMEYMEATLPVVATAVGGMSELVLDGETGLLIPPRDADALADSLQSLMDDPARRDALGRRAQEIRREQWSLDRWVGQIEELYEGRLGSVGGSPPISGR